MHISSSSTIFFITSSFILLAFSLVSLSTSTDACQKCEFRTKSQKLGKGINARSTLTLLIVSIERNPGSTISDSDDPRMEVILENLFLSAFDESIKFQSSSNEAPISFSCNYKNSRLLAVVTKNSRGRIKRNSHYLLDSSFPFSFQFQNGLF